MVDIDRGPDPRDLLAQLIADQYGRAERVDALTDATHDRDAAITANYLVERTCPTCGRWASGGGLCLDDFHGWRAGTPVTETPARVERVEYCSAEQMQDGARIQRRTVQISEWLDVEAEQPATDLVDRAAELIALGWAVKKAKGRGEVEVLIANLEADAHRTQHEETT